MTLSIGSSFIVAIVAVVCVAAFIGVVLWAQRRPYFKRASRQKNATGVKGGTQMGDPHNVAPSREEVIGLADPAASTDPAVPTDPAGPADSQPTGSRTGGRHATGRRR